MKKPKQLSEMEELVLWQETLKTVEKNKKEIEEEAYLTIIEDIHNRINKILQE